MRMRSKYNTIRWRRSSNSTSGSRSSSGSSSYRREPVKRIAVQNAHDSICEVLREFNIPYVNKTFGTKILRICCRTIVQLDNIAVILKELIKFKLIEEIGMPLTYEYKMKTLVLFLKPTSVDASEKLERVFKTCAFEYHHQMIEVEYPSKTAKLVFEANAVNDCPEFNQKALVKSPPESSISESPSQTPSVERSPSPTVEKFPSPAAVEKSLSLLKDTTDDQDQVNGIWIGYISIFALFSTLIIWEFCY